MLKLIQSIYPGLIIFLFIAEFNFGQELVPAYNDQSPSPFAGYSQPIGIAILKFEGNNDIEESLYNELKSNSDVLKKFVLFSYDVLDQQKKALGLKTLDPNNSKVLKQLYNKLEIKLIITGSSETDGRFYLKIIETSDNSEVYDKEYQDTKQSTAISDAVKLFSDNKTTDYIKKNISLINEQYDSKTVKIGDQTWMAENLNVDHYRNGDPIPEVQDPDQWKNLKSGAWCYYENKTENGIYYGKLYNWYAVNDYRGLAPEGWRIPTSDELEKLGTAVNNNGNSLKAAGQGSGAGAGTNTSGFSALLSGSRGSTHGNFANLNICTFFWSSTENNSVSACTLDLYSDDGEVALKCQYAKENGLCVRCVKDGKSTYQSGKKLTEQVNDIYETVKIGDQTWMAENLNVDHYRNGDQIPEVEDPEQWKNLKSGAWCYYENKTENGKYYGKLYNWYAVNDYRGLAPEGWRIPAQSEFETLKTAVNNDGKALLVIGNGTGTNTSGFSALLAGYCENSGLFVDLNNYTNFWSSTEIDINSAYCMFLGHNDSYIYINNFQKEFGFSVRCVKD